MFLKNVAKKTAPRKTVEKNILRKISVKDKYFLVNAYDRSTSLSETFLHHDKFTSENYCLSQDLSILHL